MKGFLRFLLALIVVNVAGVIFAAGLGFGFGVAAPGLTDTVVAKAAAILGMIAAIYAGYRVSGI